VIPGDLLRPSSEKITRKQKILIPYPINIDKLVYSPLNIENKIIIFMELTKRILKKKINFRGCFKITQNKYPDLVEIITTKSVPYATYIELS
jgi:hypothetical protein